MADINTGTSDQQFKGFYVPSAMLQKKLLSQTSNAQDCFVYQQFSGQLQAFLTGYVMSVNGIYPVYL